MCCIFPCPCPLKEKKKGKKESCPLLLCLVSLCVDALYLTACLRYFGGCFFPTSSSTSVVLLPGRQPWPNQNIRSLHVHCTSLAWCWDLWADTRKAAMFQTEVWLSSTCEAVLYYKQVCPSSQAVVLQELSGLWMGWSGCDTAKTWGPWKEHSNPGVGVTPGPFRWVGGSRHAVTCYFPPFLPFTWLKAFSLSCPCSACHQMTVTFWSK